MIMRTPKKNESEQAMRRTQAIYLIIINNTVPSSISSLVRLLLCLVNLRINDHTFNFQPTDLACVFGVHMITCSVSCGNSEICIFHRHSLGRSPAFSPLHLSAMIAFIRTHMLTYLKLCRLARGLLIALAVFKRSPQAV